MMKLLFIAALAALASAQSVTFTKLPEKFAFFARDSADSGTVEVTGTVTAADSMVLEVTRDGALWKRQVQSVTASFAFAVNIHAELAEYGLKVYANADSVGAADSLACGDAFIISGQSNSITVRPYYELADSQSQWIRSYGDAPGYPWTGWGLATGHNISSGATSGPSIGAWGWYLANALVNRHGIPVCVINGGAGGTEIRSHLKSENYLYTNHSTRAANSGLKPRIKAFLWHQGESDANGNWVYYAARFDSLYHALKGDYPGMKKVYLFQIRPGCGGTRGSELREVQRTIPASHPDIEIMATNALGGHSYQGDFCHYYASGYSQMASWIRPLIERDFYGSTDTLGIQPPDIRNAYYTSAARDQIALEFTQDPSWSTALTTQNWFHTVLSAFFVDSMPYEVRSIAADPANHRVLLNLNRRFTATRLSYLPELYYPDTAITFEGPWLVNARGIGALSFFQFPVTVPDSVADTSLAAADTLPLDSIRFAAGSALLIPGDSLKPEVTGFYHNGSGPFSRTLFSDLTWSSQDPGVATVSVDGMVSAVADGGPVSVVAQKGGASDTLALRVKATPDVLIRINFEDQGQPVLPDWSVENWGRFTEARGFGWDTSSYVTGHAYHDGTIGPWVVRTYVAVGNGNYGNERNQWARYRVQVPVGQYVLRLGAGCQVGVAAGAQTRDIIIHGNDTLMDKGYRYCEVNTHLITVAGDSGLKLNVFGAIDYIVLLSGEFARYVDYFARDSVSSGNEPPLITALKGGKGYEAYAWEVAPNPFNPTVCFRLPAVVRGAKLRVYNCAGRLVVDLSQEIKKSGVVEWNAGGRASGLYFAVLEGVGKRLVKTLVLAR